MIILVGTNKGGAGKTTTAINIAAGLSLRGFDVLGLDADNQKSMTKWGHDRELNENLKPMTIIEKTGNISKTLEAIRDKHDFIIIDVGGRNSIELISAMVVADIVISPSQCSQFDLDTMEELNEQFIRVKPLNESLQVYMYNVMLHTNHNVNRSDRMLFEDYVKDYKDFKLMDSYSCYRKIYKDVICEGKSVLEQDKEEKAALEVKKLINEILEIKAQKNIN